MNVFYFDDPDFQYDVIQCSGDFIGEIFVDISIIVNEYSDRKPLDSEMFRVIESMIWNYMNIRKSNGVKEWGCQFFDMNNMVKVALRTLFTKSSVTIDITKMKVEII